MNESAAQTIDRRPIATRNRKWAQAATAWLASRNVSPNVISIAGMCACIAAGIALGLTSVTYNRIFWFIGALGAQLRLTANMLDGMVALASGRASKVGELYNEIPDRVSDAAVFIGAGFAWGGNVALGYIATILAIFTAYVRAAGKIAGAPNEFCGPMAKQHRMLVITIACIYSAVVPRAWQIFHFDNAEVGVMGLALSVIIAGSLITVNRRLKANRTGFEMNNTTWQRLFGFRHAFDDRVTVVLTLTAVVLLVFAPLLIFIATRAANSAAEKKKELWDRYRSWIWLALCILIPILAGAFWTILAVAVLSLLCYREYARITGLFRERTISFIVVVCILLITFAELDNWYRLFVALFPLTVALIAIGGLIPDQPKGYIQRVGLGVLGFALFGSALGNLGYMANDWNYRPILLLIIFAVELNDIFAYICGHLFGHQKFVPNTSPNKTVGGALGAIILTTPLVAVIAHFIWSNTALDNPICLIGLGIIVSVVGQFGDLMLSAIKRDLGLKDTAKLIPGHGGLLDRFDSLILVAPAVFHYVGYFVAFGAGQPQRIFTGS